MKSEGKESKEGVVVLYEGKELASGPLGCCVGAIYPFRW
jgi:hypothetical protein